MRGRGAWSVCAEGARAGGRGGCVRGVRGGGGRAEGARGGVRRVRAVRSASRVTLAARAPGGGDSGPLICRCANFKLPQLGEETARSQGEKSSPPKKFHLVVGGGRVGGNATPAGPGEARGQQEGREPISPFGWCQSAPQRSLDPRRGRRTASQTDEHVLGRAEGRAPGAGRGAVPRAGRSRAAAGRARRYPAESPAGQRTVARGGGSAAAGRPDAGRARPQVTRGSRPVLGDQMQSPVEGASQMRDDS